MKESGLTLRNGIWHVNKVINGVRICRSTKTGDRAEAEKILRDISSVKTASFAAEAWADRVDRMVDSRGSWIDKTIKRINKPSVISSKGHPTITRQTLRLLLLRSNGKCELTGIRFSSEIPENCRSAPFEMSLDRIDSSKGYHTENCRIVCLAVNLAMREWGESVVLKIGRAMMHKELSREFY